MVTDHVVDGTRTAARPAAGARPRRPAARRWREALAVGFGAPAAAVIMTWPVLLHPASRIPQEFYDPLYETWAAAWFAHAFVHQPLHPFDGNAFWPLAHSLGFADVSPGFAPFMLGAAGPSDALVRYNLLYVLAAAVNLAGAYALARQLGSGRAGAAVAGAAFAFTPWRLAHAMHLNILFTGGVPLALALLLRGHGVGGPGAPMGRVRPCRAGPETAGPVRSRFGGAGLGRARPGLVFAGWAVAAWQVSLGFAVGLSFAYVLMGLALTGGIAWAVRRPPLSRRLLAADAAGAALFAAVVVMMGQVLLRVAREFPEMRRGMDALRHYSPPLRGLWTAKETSAVWGPLTAASRAALPEHNETTLFPGLLVVLLAAIGLFASAWTVRRRAWLAAAVSVGVVLALGTTVLGGRWTWVPLRGVLPGVEAVRTSGRLVIWAVLALGLLAAGAVTRFERSPRVRRVPFRVALAALPVLVALEGLPAVPDLSIPDPPAALRGVRAPVLVLPSRTSSDYLVMYWSIGAFLPFGNGGAYPAPGPERALRRATANFPDAPSVAYLRRRGYRTVVVPWLLAGPDAWARATGRSLAGLPVHRAWRADGVVFTLDPPAPGRPARPRRTAG